MLVALAIAGLTTPVSAGNVSSVPPPAIEFNAPAKNAERQRKVYVQTGSGIGGAYEDSLAGGIMIRAAARFRYGGCLMTKFHFCLR